MNTLAIIPARGGSKGIPRKNIADLGGRPLLDWTIKAALEADLVPHVSTEDPEIARIAKRCGAAVLDRPENLASDTATTQQVVDHHLPRFPDADAVCVLHPTSPFRSSGDISACLRMVEEGFASVVSITEPDRHPWHMVRRLPDGSIRWREDASKHLPPRQKFPEAWAINGAIYCANREVYVAQGGFIGPDTWGYQMPRERSLDIDEPWDLEVARALVGNAVKVAA